MADNNTEQSGELKNPGNAFGADNENARKTHGGTIPGDEKAESQVPVNQAITGGTQATGGSGGQGGGSQGGGGQGNLDSGGQGRGNM